MINLKKVMFIYFAVFLFSVLLQVCCVDDTSAISYEYPNGSTMSWARIVNECANVHVNNSFTYSIEALEDEYGDPINPNGGISNMPTQITININNKFPDDDDVVVDGVTYHDHVDDIGLIDLAGLNISKVGDYFFKITEVSSSNPDIYPLDVYQSGTLADGSPVYSPDYYIFGFSVRYKVENGIVDTNKFVVTVPLVAESSNGNKLTPIFSSDMSTMPIFVSNITSGNIANINDCFEYKIRVEPGYGGLTVNDASLFAYIVHDAHYIINESFDLPPTCSNPGGYEISNIVLFPYTVGNEFTFRISNNEVVFIDLPVGARYTVTKVSVPSGYTTLIDDNNVNSITKTTIHIDDDVMLSDMENYRPNTSITLIKNVKNYAEDTNVFTDFRVYAILVGSAIAGLFAVFLVKKFKK